MKKNEMFSYLSGFSLIAISVCLMALPASSQEGQGANNQGNVSAVGTPPAQPASPSADALVPPPAATQGATPAATGNEFPPQPVSVAPAENAASTSAKPVVAPATDANVASPVPQGDSGVVNGTNVMGDGGVQQKHSGTYYDSEALVPDSDLAKSGATGPRKVDPAYEPGQKFVVVEKGAKASSFEGQYVAATRALKLGRYAAAMEMFEKLYKKNPRDERVLMGLAVAQQGAGFTESAAKSYEDLLHLQPNNANAIVNLMGIMKDQYPSVTLKKLMELRDKYPSNPGIPAQIAMVNSKLENYDDAIRYFEIASSMDPRNAGHVFNMAVALDKKGDVNGAIKTYERALELDSMYGDVANSLPRKEIYDRLVVLRRKG